MIREELDVWRVLRIVTETLDALVDGRLVHRVSVQVEQQRLNRRVHTLSQHTPERKMSHHSIPASTQRHMLYLQVAQRDGSEQLVHRCSNCNRGSLQG